jgi:hypothetical protein
MGSETPLDGVVGDEKVALPTLPVQQPRKNGDLFRVGWLLRFFKSRGMRFALQFMTVAVFGVVAVAGLIGAQSPDRNAATVLTWTLWWTLLIVMVVLFGKVWCYVCPWLAVSEWIERLAFWRRTPDASRLSMGLKWPKWLKNIWPATVLFVIVTWLELGVGITYSPVLTAYLALGMVVLALVPALVYDRNAFCEHGCFVGLIQGVYGMVAPFALRSRDKGFCKTGCTTKDCYVGGADGYACPVHEYMGTMSTNTTCMLCMECVTTCGHDNISLNARWGLGDFAERFKPRSDIGHFCVIVTALSFFHAVTMLTDYYLWMDTLAQSGYLLAFTGVMAAIVLGTALLHLRFCWWARVFAEREHVPLAKTYLTFAYALVPLAALFHLSHNVFHVLSEGQKVVPVLSDPFGFGWNLFGTADWYLPPIVGIDPIHWVQLAIMVLGTGLSIAVARRMSGRLFETAEQARLAMIPMTIWMLLIGAAGVWLNWQPMVLRTGI